MIGRLQPSRILGQLGPVSLAAAMFGCSSQAGQVREISATQASGAKPVPVEEPKAADAEFPTSAGYDSGWRVAQAFGQSIELPVPDAASWAVQEGGRWWHIRHAASSSQLLIRTWRAPRSSSPQACEHQARLWRPELPEVPIERAILRDRLNAPKGFHTELSVGVTSQRGRSVVEGVALAFGSRPGRCLAMVYTTRAEGPAAEAMVAERLAAIADNSFANARELSIDDRARVPDHRLP